MNLHTSLKINVQVKFCDFLEAKMFTWVKTKAHSRFWISSQISLGQDISSGDYSLGRILSELSVSTPGKKNRFNDFGHITMSRKADIMNIKYFFFMKEVHEIDKRNIKNSLKLYKNT